MSLFHLPDMCMYVCMCVCVCMHVYFSLYPQKKISPFTWHVYVCMYTCIFFSVSSNMHTRHTYTCTDTHYSYTEEISCSYPHSMTWLGQSIHAHAHVYTYILRHMIIPWQKPQHTSCPYPHIMSQLDQNIHIHTHMYTYMDTYIDTYTW